MGFEEYKPTLDKLTSAAEQLALTTATLAEQLKSINDRLIKLEKFANDLDTKAQVIDSPVHRGELCPYRQKFEEYDRLLFSPEGFVRRIADLESTINFYRGAIWIMGGAITLLSGVLVVILVKVL